MAKPMRRLGEWALGVMLLVTPAAFADNADMDRARDLFLQRDYRAAQELLLKIQEADLNDDEKGERAQLLQIIPQAIDSSQRAAREKIDADAAYNAGKWSEAEKLYKSIGDNDYAAPELRSAAKERLAELSKKQQFAHAAQPSGPVSGSQEQSGQPMKRVTGQMTPVNPSAQQAAPRSSTPQMQTTPMQPATSSQMRQSAPPAGPPGRQTLVDELRTRDNLAWQRAVAKMQEAGQLVETAIAAENFEEARRLAESAVQVIEASRAYAYPPSKYDAARAAAEAIRERVTSAHEAYSINKAEDQRQEIAEQVQIRRELLERLRREKVEQLFNTAQQLQRERRFEEAAEAIRQLLSIDPANDAARLSLDIYEDFASLALQTSVQREAEKQRVATLNEADAAKIPWHQDVLYPKNWLEISTRRDALVEGAGVSDEDFELNRRLEEVQPEISFIEQPFDQVVDFITDLNQINLAVDWDDLDLNGISRDKPISIKLRDVSLQTVITEVLTQVGGDVALGYSVGDGLIRIASKEKLDRDKYILVYDIRDLLVNIPRFANGPQIQLSQQNAVGQGGNQNIFGGGDSDGRGGDEDSDGIGSIGDSKDVAKLLDIIRQTVEPESWQESGGGGALRELNGQLIVYNTSDGQRQVRDLLGQLRDQRALMIGVEARFLTVASNFLEEIGVDLDFVFNQGSAGFDRAFNNQGQGLFDPFTGSALLVPRRFSRAGVFPSVPGAGTAFGTQPPPAQPFGQAAYVPTGTGIIPQFSNSTPIGVNQGGIDLVNPVGLNTGVPGSIAQAANFAPALNIAGSFLDNLQVDFLIRATQANRRSSVVQAPRLMMFNGQRAWVAVTLSRQYVASVTAQVAEGAVGVQPQIQTVPSGNSLDVEGTISADRKYVTLTLRLGFAQEPDIDRFEVQRASGNSPGIFVSLVTQESQAINTTVSVPDGGTVLIGGLKQVGEIEMEAGVPILSKIPLLKRAFTNTTTVKDTQTLLILIKTKILIQNETEEEAFPTLRAARG